jgi:acetyl-CoA carboxylase carboxyl transferase subunit alpha
MAQRKNKFLKIGRDKGFISDPEKISELKYKTRKYDLYLGFFKENKLKFLGFAIIIFLSLYFYL